MKFIAHRINTIAELKEVPTQYGVEVDLRDRKDRIILSHDPFQKGEDLEEYLKNYRHGTLILNIKSERIEPKVLELLNKYKVRNYFFLDSSFPMVFQLASKGEKNIALRFSEVEGLDTIKNMQDKAAWIWIDCFTRLPLDKQNYQALKNTGLKLCLVSPDLQGQAAKIPEYKDFLTSNNIELDAICCKIQNIKYWR